MFIHTLHIDVHQDLQKTDMINIQKECKKPLQILF